MGEYRERFNLVKNDVKRLRITIDKDLTFDHQVLKLCSKANQKLSATSRMAKLFSFN